MKETNTLKHNSEISKNNLISCKLKTKNIELCQQRAWRLAKELQSYSAFFRNLDSCDFSQDEFYGISLQFERMSKRLDKISSLLFELLKDD